MLHFKCFKSLYRKGSLQTFKHTCFIKKEGKYIMLSKILKNKEEFIDECECAYKILSFVKNDVETDVKWWFDVAYREDNRYSVLFKSYIIEEYKDYILSITSEKIDGEWELKVFKKVDGLTK